MKSRNAIRGIIIALFITTQAIVSVAEVPDSYGNRLVAAERYLQVTSIKDTMRDMIAETAKNLPGKARKTHISLMTKHIKIDILEHAVLASMATILLSTS